jgi:hypothetical protein
MSVRNCVLTILMLNLVVMPISVAAQNPCAGNRVANASFEEGSESAAAYGARASSIVAQGWTPWAVWTYHSRAGEAQFDVEDISRLGRYSTYRTNSGRFSQKFGTEWSLHQAGLAQRVAVPSGATVTFSIYVQILTGENPAVIAQERVSDLTSAGNYRAYVGIDPTGASPPAFGARPPDDVVWSAPVLDRETRNKVDSLDNDAWVRLEVRVKAQSDHVTVYTKGQPEFAVRYNTSYWDDACLTFVAPTPAATSTKAPTAVPTATQTAMPAPTLSATPTPNITKTAEPTMTAEPTATASLPPATSAPTSTLVPTATSTVATVPSPIPTKMPPATGGSDAEENPLGLVVFAALWLSAVGYLVWSLLRRRLVREVPDESPPHAV